MGDLDADLDSVLAEAADLVDEIRKHTPDDAGQKMADCWAAALTSFRLMAQEGNSPAADRRAMFVLAQRLKDIFACELSRAVGSHTKVALRPEE